MSNVSTSAPPTNHRHKKLQDPHHSTTGLWSRHQAATADSSSCYSSKSPDFYFSFSSFFLMVIWARTCTVKLHTFHIQSKNKRLETPKLEACSRICSALTAWLWIIWGWRAYCIYTTAVGITLCYFTWKLAFSVVFSNCYNSFYFHKLSKFLLISFTHTQKKKKNYWFITEGQ